MTKKTTAEKRLELRNRFKSIMKALDEQGQEMLQAILDEIEALYAASDEEGAAELVSTLAGKVDELKAKLPEGDVAAAESVSAVEEEVKKLSTALTNLKHGGKGGDGVKSIREVIRENADKLKALKSNQGGKLTLEVKTPMTRPVAISSGGEYIPMPEFDSEIGREPLPERTILQDVSVRTTDTPSVVYADMLPHNGDAAFIKEGQLKPQVDFKVQAKRTDAKKVADTIKISTEMLDDIDWMASEAEELARRLVNEKIAENILKGNGTDPNLLGITNQVGGYVSPEFSGLIDNANVYDALLAAASQIWGLGYKGRLLVHMNSFEIAKMKMIKDKNANYMTSGNLLENIDIVADPDLASGEFIIGDFKKVKVFVRKELTLEWGYGILTDPDTSTVMSDWEANFITLRCEARLGMYIKENDKAAFVHDNIATVLADITKPAA
jgi:HK97 family phage major capsid protein